MNRAQMEELLYESLETEQGGVQIYETAVQCARNDDLQKEWTRYLEETRNHETIMLRVLDTFGLEPDRETPGRHIVKSKAETLVTSMKTALASDPATAQLVAAAARPHRGPARAPSRAGGRPHAGRRARGRARRLTPSVEQVFDGRVRLRGWPAA